MADYNLVDLIKELGVTPISGAEFLRLFLNLDTNTTSFISSVDQNLLKELINKLDKNAKDVEKSLNKNNTNLAKTTKDLSENVSKNVEILNTILTNFDSALSSNLKYLSGILSNFSEENGRKLNSINSKIEQFSGDMSGNITKFVENINSNTSNLDSILKEFSSRIEETTIPKIDETEIKNDSVFGDLLRNSFVTNTLLQKVLDSLKEQSVGKDQKTFTDDGISKNQISEILPGIKNLLEELKNKKTSEDKKKDIIETLAQGSIMSSIWSGILSIGGLLLLGSLLYEKYLKPLLEEKFGIFLPDLELVIQNLIKIVSTASLQIINPLIKLVENFGKAITHIGNVTSSIGKFFGGGAKAVATEGAEVAGKAVATEGTEIAIKSAGGLAKLGGVFAKFGGMFSKIGIGALKAIPYLGSFISFGFGIYNIIQGNYTQGILDFVNGLVGLIPGVGPFASVLISGFQIFLELKTLGIEDKSQKNAAQFGMIKDAFKNIFKYIWDSPIMAPIRSFSDAMFELFNGNWRKAISNLAEVPIIGTPFALLHSFLESVEVESGSVFPKMNFQNMKKEFAVKMIKAWVPDIFGLRKKVASMVGVENEFSDSVESDINDVNSPEFQKNLDNQIEIAKKEEFSESNLKTYEQYVNQQQEKANKISKEAGLFPEDKELQEKMRKAYAELEMYKTVYENEKAKLSKTAETFTPEDIQKSEDEYKKLQEQLKNISEPKRIKVDDVFIPSYQEKSKSVYDPATNTEFILNSNDNIMAFKSNGDFLNALSDMKSLLKNITQLLVEQSKTKIQNSPISNVSINSSSVTTESSNDKGYQMSGTRDPIFDARMDYWRKFPTDRVFV